MAHDPAPRITLPDGRRLAYTSHGPAAGLPLLYCHGAPASKHNWYLNHDPALLTALNLRVVAIDRPGLGGSDPQPARALADWVHDLESFADALGLERFALLGYSCGAPYALACAVRLAERVTHTTIVSGMVDATWPELAALPAPQSFKVLQLASTNPRASRLVYRLMALSARYLPDVMLKQARSTMPTADQEVLAEPAVRTAFLDMLHETFAQGPRGAQVDSAIVGGAWGLDVGGIRGRVDLWHGDADLNVPVEMARHLAARLPHAELRVMPGEGHLSLVHRHVGRILSAIAARQQPA